MSQLRSVGSGADVLSMSAKSTRTTLPYASVAPSYVSISEAESLVDAELERTFKISAGAIRLLNGFLDQILYDILVKSQSVGLTSIRAAIPLILKQRLGRAAIKSADEELQDYLDEDELEDLQNTTAVLDPRAEFDVDLAWKLTRLRCMVYAKLGDMEEEDEEDYLESDDIGDHLDQVRESFRSSARIAPPAAIFLTTILEFIAEQALCISAQHAKKRRQYLQNMARDTDQHHLHADSIQLEEIDMSGIGKEGPLIRLWRSWKGSTRMTGSGSSRPTTPNAMSPMSPDSPAQEFRFPATPAIHSIQEESSRSVTPANVPLPMNERDVEEIESPAQMGDKGEQQRPSMGKRKSTSMLAMPGQFPEQSVPNTPSRPIASRRRSRSVPSSGDRYSWQPPPRQRPVPIDSKSGDQSPVSPVQAPRDQSDDVHASHTSTVIGATVASIAGALGVEAARSRRAPQHVQDESLPVPSPPVEPQSSINTATDFERMHIPQRAPTTRHHDAGEQAEANDPEDLALSSSEDERMHDHTHHRDSGFGDENAQHAPHEASDEDLPLEREREFEPPRYPVAPSARSSNLGYATIFSAPDTAASSIYSSARTSRQDPHEAAEDVTTPRAIAPTTSAWPAVVPKRRSSLEQRQREQFQNEGRPTPPPAPANGDQFVPRYATSAFATPHSRNASANQTRPSTSGSATARRQHMRLRSDDQAWIPEEHDKAKQSLDLLIDSDQTLHYTLTPETVAAQTPKKSQTQELADFFKNTVPPGEEVRPKSSKSTREGLNGLRANPLTPPGTSKAPLPPIDGHQPSSPRVRNRIGEPREPTVNKNNTRDLADYARSTGPEHDAQLPRSLGGRPSTAPKKSDLSLRERALAEDTRPNTSKSTNRLKYQARDAQVPRTTDTSDLIDFIREGPPRAAGEHRIDRHVAPFRTTMDSDDLNALAPNINPRKSDASFQDSAITAKSMPSTVNSRTGLLESTNRPKQKPPVIPETDGVMPKRTQRRTRDPYAIDYSDEEQEVDDNYAPPPRRKGEESLVDFLRNTAPPPGMTTQPILAALPSPTQPDAEAMVRRTASGSRLKDFLPGGKEDGGSPRVGARASSPHLTQNGSKMDKYRPTTTTHAAHVDRNRQKPASRTEPPAYSGKAAGVSTGTSDLAAFLMNSEPPPGMQAKPVQRFNGAVQKDQAGFMKFFQRRGSVRK